MWRVVERWVADRWFSFVTAHPAVQILGLVTLSVLTGILFAYFLTIWLEASRAVSISEVARTFRMLVTNEFQRGETLGYGGAVYIALSVLLVAIWQSAFILKILTRSHRMRFSRAACHAPVVDFERVRADGELDPSAGYLMFRMLNEGKDTLYDAEVKVTLRYYDVDTETFVFYQCEPEKGVFPILSPGMPFTVYVHTGRPVHSGSYKALYVQGRTNGGEETLNDGVKVLSREQAIHLMNMHGHPEDYYAFVVYFQAFDGSLDQTKSASVSYPLTRVADGLFQAMKPDRKTRSALDGFFSRSNVRKNFDAFQGDA